MSIEENKALMRRWFTEPPPEMIRQIQEAEDPKSLIEKLIRPNAEKVFAPDCILHYEGVDSNWEEIIKMNLEYLAAFPDASFVVENMLAEGDFVAIRVTMRGTNLGPFRGIPATGKKIEMGYMDLCRIAGGKIVEVWVYSDTLGLMQQLGAIPKP